MQVQTFFVQNYVISKFAHYCTAVVQCSWKYKKENYIVQWQHTDVNKNDVHNTSSFGYVKDQGKAIYANGTVFQ